MRFRHGDETVNPKPYVIERRWIDWNTGRWGPWELLQEFRLEADRDKQLRQLRQLLIGGSEFRGVVDRLTLLWAVRLFRGARA